jgi:hypothetical protein
MSGFYGWGAWNHGGVAGQGRHRLMWKPRCTGRTRGGGGSERSQPLQCLHMSQTPLSWPPIHCPHTCKEHALDQPRHPTHSPPPPLSPFPPFLAINTYFKNPSLCYAPLVPIGHHPSNAFEYYITLLILLLFFPLHFPSFPTWVHGFSSLFSRAYKRVGWANDQGGRMDR